MLSKRRLVKFAYTFFAAILTALVFSGATVYAANTNLPEGFIIVDSDGIHAESNGQYLLYVKNITPGDVITKTLTIRNMETGSKPFHLSMMAEPGQVFGPVDLLDKIFLEITMDGNRLYSGRLHGDRDSNMIKNALPLGKYASGDSNILTLKLTVAKDFSIGFEKSSADITWKFNAVRDETADPPRTGDIITYTLYVLGVMIILAAIILFLLQKKREKNEKQTTVPV